mgnify:CR=1 FL=1
MRTLAEIELKSDELKCRMNQLLSEIAGSKSDRIEELAEELGKIIFEIKVLNTSVVYFREMAEMLVNSECSGPH